MGSAGDAEAGGHGADLLGARLVAGIRVWGCVRWQCGCLLHDGIGRGDREAENLVNRGVGSGNGELAITHPGG
jgi:hypothetical protein